ncbi:hypothetical protein RhiirA4_476562 [Rhizophagus irregularis]|uniref:Uncharacterized protein n=1 Tax=Rhizophagus irregularis TaxID=588596 RepID=A0A2I1HBX5_9GLOM|nr:hypothetical protein RhiirA4_476562 [Rhizophagus irregularis]
MSNSKYNTTKNDWLITFEYVKENESALTTSFWTTKRRRKKLQRLLEEMPTVEQCSIKYTEIGCVFVVKGKKKPSTTFEKIKSYEKYNLEESSVFIFLKEEKYFRLLVDNINLTFIDIIKGIFPLSLSEFLRQKIKMNDKDRIEVSINFLNFIYDETKLIWKERCERQINKEKRLKISRKKKMITNNVGLGNVLNIGNILKREPITRAEGLLNSIYFNQKPLDFIIHVNWTILLINFFGLFNF